MEGVSDLGVLAPAEGGWEVVLGDPGRVGHLTVLVHLGAGRDNNQGVLETA